MMRTAGIYQTIMDPNVSKILLVEDGKFAVVYDCESIPEDGEWQDLPLELDELMKLFTDVFSDCIKDPWLDWAYARSKFAKENVQTKLD